MKRHLLAAGGSIAALSLALAFGPAVAQVAPSAFTPETVVPTDPFGEIDIDLAMIDMTNIAAYLATLTPEVRLEVEQRCAVITANAAAYEANVVTFCTAVIEAAAPAPAPVPM